MGNVNGYLHIVACFGPNNISSRFPRDFEADTLELQENHGEMFLLYNVHSNAFSMFKYKTNIKPPYSVVTETKGLIPCDW